MAKEVSLPSVGDTAIAYDALTTMMDLTRIEVAVAGLLLNHFNRKNGRCDPSVERIAIILDINRASVLRATKRLSSGDDRLFDKVSHGGHAHCASYSPRWTMFRKHWTEKNAQRAKKTDALNVAKMRPSKSHECDSQRRSNATQTSCMNLIYEPHTAEDEDTEGQTGLSEAKDKPSEEKRKGLLNGSVWGRTPNKQVKPRVVVSVSHSVAAEESASKAWEADLRSLGSSAYGDVIDHITEPIMLAATAAEMKNRGGGLRFIASALGLQILRTASIHGKEH